MRYPKIVAFEANHTLFAGDIDNVCPASSTHRSEDDLMRENDFVVRNKRMRAKHIRMFGEVPRIVCDAIHHGAKLAIVSRAKNKDALDRALWFFHAKDSRTDQMRPIIHMVDFDEVSYEAKTKPLQRIRSWSGFDYADMILFDYDSANHLVQVELGVTFQVTRNQHEGLTWNTYQKGLKTWRGLQDIRSPYRDQRLTSYASPMFIGYAGMDKGTIQLVTKGSHRVDLKESARWGYAMYIADDVKIAKYFADWIKRDAGFAGTQVCELWVRDAGKFRAMNKVWFPEDNALMNDVHKQSQLQIGQSQEHRDALAARWEAPAPYILFSRHFKMRGMPSEVQGRWNEMVVYTQIQDALMLTIPLSDRDVGQKMRTNAAGSPFHKAIKRWNIKVPAEAWADFKNHNETVA